MAAGTVVLRPRSCLVITLAQAGNGTSEVSVGRNLEIADASVLCTATDSGGTATAQLFRQALGSGAYNALTNTMACTTINLLARTTTLTVAEATLANTDVLRTTIASAGGGTANGKVFVDVNLLPV